MSCTVNTESTTVRVNGRFIIPRMGRRVLLFLLTLHIVDFVIIAAAVVVIIIIIVIVVFVTSKKKKIGVSYLEFYLSLLYNELTY